MDPILMKAPPLSAAVWGRVQADFAPEMRSRVEEQLLRYAHSPFSREPERVQLAILHLAKGKPDDVVEYTDAACRDYRDVLYWAYYYEPPTTQELEVLARLLHVNPAELPAPMRGEAR